MNAFQLVNSINDEMDAYNKAYAERTGLLLAALGCIMNRLQFAYPEAYAEAEEYIEKVKAGMVEREQEKLNVAA